MNKHIYENQNIEVQSSEDEYAMLKDRCRRRITRSYFIVAIVVFFAEILISIVMCKLGMQVSMNREYIIKYILTPSCVCLVCALVANFICDRKVPSRIKDLSLILALAIMCFMLSMVHGTFLVIYSLFFLPTLVATLLDNRRYLYFSSILSVILLFVSLVFVSYYDSSWELIERIMNILVALVVMIVETLVCRNITYYGEAKNKIIFKSDELRQAKQVAEMANKAKSDFLAKMSHEIRTPINAVIGMDEMILTRSKDEEIERYALDIKGAATTLLSIINEILDSSKIESGKMEIVPVNYEIASMLNDLYNMISFKASQKNLELVFDIDKEIPVGYFGDDVRIRQCVTNLLSNAVKYTDKGTVTLSVTATYSAGFADLTFAVKDTGIGIKKEDMSKLFEDFTRINLEKNRSVEGTGLGMTITARLLELMDSKLEVESVYGIGSVFSFTIRQKIVNGEKLGDFNVRIEKSAESYKFVQRYKARDAKILLVDDNNINRKVFRSLLSEAEIKIDEAADGYECINMLKKNSYDLVFLDHMMPGIDGIETFKIIKDENLCPNTPIVMLSANAVTGAREQYIEMGFSNYLPKPIEADKLDEMIMKYVRYEIINQDESEKAAPAQSMSAPVKQADTYSFLDEEVPQVSIKTIEEFDWNMAMKTLGDEELLLETLKDFYDSCDEVADKLGRFLEAASNTSGEERDKNIYNYRVEVHALKSTAAIFGAMLLSKTARLGELAAKENNFEKLSAIHPFVIEELNKHKERLAELFTK